MAFDKVKNFLNVDIDDGVPGTAIIRTLTDPIDKAHSYNATMSLLVQVEGSEPYEVSHTCMVEAEYRLEVGSELPVTVDRDNRDRMEIEWGYYRTRDERRQELAAQAIAGSKEAQRELLAGTDQGPPVDVDKANEAARRMNERMAPPHLTGSKPAAPHPPDPADRLRELGELREGGLITDEEFAAKKAEILGDI